MSDLKIDDLGRNGFRLYQDDSIFKLGTASVLLAWFAASFIRQGHADKARMLELGSGIGSAAVCAAARLPVTKIDCIELQEKPFEILLKNIELNHTEDRMRAFNCDLRDLPAEVKSESYDVVFMNPPFFSDTRGPATDTGRNSQETLISRFGEDDCLEAFVSTASRRTRTSGGFTVMCMTAERLPESLECFARNGLAPSRLINVHSTANKDSFLSLLAGKKGAPNTDFRVLPPLILSETDGQGNNVRTARYAAIYEEEHKDCFIS
ncbi:MAG: methyltransferase [Clostridiales bacterium]|nr:methyltransferase [Clostridiales bacterium]